VKYAVVIEKLSNNYCAHVPDLPVCVTTGATVEETVSNVRDAIKGYVESCRSHGDPVPQPTTLAFELEVA
jgi:predicted RNase H-like HicB family nuclease